MTVTIRIPSVRSLALVVVGAAIGAMLVAPVMARGTDSGATTIEPAATQSRTTSCHGFNFHPIDGTTVRAYSGTLTYRSGSAGSGYFVCDPGLPNKAVVTRVRFTVQDTFGVGSISDCGLFRSGLGTSTATSYQELAAVPPTGGSVNGLLRLTDASITNATVNNAQYAYWLQCRITDQASASGIYGADVTYTISSANG